MSDNVRRFPWRKSAEFSAADLVRECGERLTDRELWKRFQERFQGLIFLYLMRALRINRIEEDVTDLVPDLAQEVYVRLVQNDGRVLRSFRGETEFSVMAFLGKISASVVHDHQRANAANRRRGHIVSIESAQAAEVRRVKTGDSPQVDSSLLSSIASLIDVERVVEGDPDRKHARRNALIFKLHYIDGFSAAEIAEFPGFELESTGVEAILKRLRKRIQE